MSRIPTGCWGQASPRGTTRPTGDKTPSSGHDQFPPLLVLPRRLGSKAALWGLPGSPLGVCTQGTPSLGGLCSRPPLSPPPLGARRPWPQAPARSPQWQRQQICPQCAPGPSSMAGMSGISRLQREIFLRIYIPVVNSLLQAFPLCTGVEGAPRRQAREEGPGRGGLLSLSPKALHEDPVTLHPEVHQAAGGGRSQGTACPPRQLQGGWTPCGGTELAD